MMDTLRIRTYCGRSGHGTLVSFPDRRLDGVVETRHILIDLGGVPADETDGRSQAALQRVIDDVLAALDGKPLDLYVMTHTHTDHIQGLHYADRIVYPDRDLRQELRVRHVWLTASMAEDYDAVHPEARRRHHEMHTAYDEIRRFLEAYQSEVQKPIQRLVLNNNPLATNEHAAYLRELARSPRYVHRGFSLGDDKPFYEATVEFWAPEEDAAIYFSPLRPMELGVVSPTTSRGKPALATVIPPSGVEANAFYKLVWQRRWVYVENLKAIDQATNNTSIVFCLEWRGWRLLFAGHADDRSWWEMSSAGVLKPVHFLKVSHHGSQTGLPPSVLLDKILPRPLPDGKPQHAVVSTHEGPYGTLDHRAQLYALLSVLEELDPRCEVHYKVEKDPAQDGGYLDIEFEAWTQGVSTRQGW